MNFNDTKKLITSNIKYVHFIIKFTIQELVYTSTIGVCYFITSIIQISLTNRDDYETSLTLYGYYGGYITAGVCILL